MEVVKADLEEVKADTAAKAQLALESQRQNINNSYLIVASCMKVVKAPQA